MFPNAADGEEFSESDADEGFDEDLEALRRACILTGNDPDALQPSSSSAFAPDRTTDSDSEEDDLELIRGIQQRFAACTDMETPLFLKPLSTLPPASLDDDEDDFETLRAIQRRFSGYDKDILKSSKENHPNKLEHVTATKMALEKDASNNLVAQRNKLSEGFPDMSDFCNTSQNLESLNDNILKVLPSDLIEWHQPDTHSFSNFSTTDTGFPKSAQMFVDAIKKNRACQKFLRSKLMQIEARIEENKKLKKRVKVLKDFQVTCKTRTGRSLSQKKDARVQLISSIKPRANSKVKRKKFSSLYYGPDENPHVANYRMVLAKFPISLNREKWTEAERENLAKGIKQQFQELLLQKSVDLISDMEGSSGDFNDVDSIVASIRDVDITPENIRSFLPKVNWKRLAAMYVTSRSGAECEARWLNYEDPLICQNPWTNMEDKKLLHIIQQRGINNWIDISVLLGTNRTPFQCLARYQRSLNASILKREWTEDEDEKLRAAVEAFGESNWQPVASALEGRTGTQCSNRSVTISMSLWRNFYENIRGKKHVCHGDRIYTSLCSMNGGVTAFSLTKIIMHRYYLMETFLLCRFCYRNNRIVSKTELEHLFQVLERKWIKSLNPARKRIGKWTLDEDKRLKVAVMIFGHKTWKKIAHFVPGRTHVQCRERWFNVLDPSLIFGEWTEEEDSRLEEAISVHGYCWYKVAACVPPRTDSQCRRRWKALRPSEVPLLQAAKKIQKAALISNFVDRESERPALGPNDFIPLALMSTVTESENINHSREQKRRSRRRSRSKGNGKGCSSNWQIEAPVCSTEVPLLTNGTEAQNFGDNGATSKKKKVAKKRSEPNVVENGKKVRPSDGGTKTKKSFGRQKRKSTGKPEATEIDTASSDELISKKQRAMKPRSKKNRGSDTTKAHSSTSADLELLIRRTSEEEGGEHCAAAAAKNRKASKRGKRKSSCVKLRDEFLGMINSDEGINNISKTNKQLYLSQLKQDKHMDSTQVDSSACLASTVRITNVDEDEAFCDDGARKKTYRKLHSRSKYSRLQQELSEITDSSEFETLGGNDAILKKKMMTKESLNGCNSLNNLATSNSFYASEAACENHATKKRKASKPCSRSISSDSPWHSKSLETSDRDNTTLHTMKRAHNVNPTRKSPKRLVQHQNNSLSSVEVANLQAKQTETAKLEERSRIISSPEKCLTYDLSANGDLIAPGICKLETIKRSMKRRKTHSVQVLEAEDGDDMTLAFFIKSIVQRRRLRFAKESSNASSPDYMKGSELFHKENCCNDKRNNVLPSQAM